MDTRISGLVALLALTLVAAFPRAAAADPTQLEGGVLILHNPIGQNYSITPPEGWCQNYLDHFAISSCEEQVNRIDTWPWEGCGKTWFVLAAWTEPKEFAGVEFGLGSFTEYEWLFGAWGPCFPGEGSVEATPGWPGPNQGVRLTAIAPNWSGNFVPVYYFCGAGYYFEDPHVLPLAPHPVSGFAGFTNALDPPQSWSATCLGAMGWLTDGVPCCPQAPQGLPDDDATPQPSTSWSAIKAIYR